MRDFQKTSLCIKNVLNFLGVFFELLEAIEKNVIIYPYFLKKSLILKICFLPRNGFVWDNLGLSIVYIDRKFTFRKNIIYIRIGINYINRGT